MLSTILATSLGAVIGITMYLVLRNLCIECYRIYRKAYLERQAIKWFANFAAHYIDNTLSVSLALRAHKQNNKIDHKYQFFAMCHYSVFLSELEHLNQTTSSSMESSLIQGNPSLTTLQARELAKRIFADWPNRWDYIPKVTIEDIKCRTKPH